MVYGINKAIVELCTTGHHPVYLKHILEYFKNKKVLENRYFFVLNAYYKDMYSSHIDSIDAEFFFFSQAQIDKLFDGNMMFVSAKLTHFINNFSKKHNIKEVILMDMNIYQFGLLFTHEINYKGIVFSQYFRQNRSKSLYEKIRYFKRELLVRFLIKKKNIKCIYFLNDPKGVDYENRKLNTDKLKSLIDPVEQFDYDNIIDVKFHYSIPREDKVFLHYGSFDERKGSELILDCLLEMDESLFKGNTLIFAGKTNNVLLEKKINEKILSIIDKGLNVVYINKYIDKLTTESIFMASDYVLCPYKSIEASSGNVGLAIASNTIIIGPNSGLLGSLINETGLGITIDEINKKSLCETIKTLFIDEKINRISIVRLESRSPNLFVENIIF